MGSWQLTKGAFSLGRHLNRATFRQSPPLDENSTNRTQMNVSLHMQLYVYLGPNSYRRVTGSSFPSYHTQNGLGFQHKNRIQSHGNHFKTWTSDISHTFNITTDHPTPRNPIYNQFENTRNNGQQLRNTHTIQLSWNQPKLPHCAK